MLERQADRTRKFCHGTPGINSEKYKATPIDHHRSEQQIVPKLNVPEVLFQKIIEWYTQIHAEARIPAAE
jgi:hypothetical protein